MEPKRIPGWDVKDNKLYKKFAFKNFIDLMQFLNQVADLAESKQHHPDFYVSYNKLEFFIWSHDQNKITGRDEELSLLIEKEYNEFIKI